MSRRYRDGSDEPRSAVGMRDLAVSMARCGWAMTLLGGQAMLDAAGGRQRRAALGTLDDGALRAERELGEPLGSLYRTGARVATELLDAGFRLGRGTPFDADRWRRTLADAATRTAKILVPEPTAGERDGEER